MEREERNIFKNAFVLTNEYIPTNLQHRTEQINQMNYQLSSLAKYGIITNNLVLFGPPGTGKTHTTKSLLEKYKGRVEVFYVKAFRNYTVHAFFKRFLETSFGLRVHSRDNIAHYYASCEKALEKKRNAIIVIDDLHFLIHSDPAGLDGMLFFLSRLPNNISLILIGNINMNELTGILEAPTLDTLKPRSVLFPRYNASELSDILMDRARVALKPPAFKKSQKAVSKIAAATANAWGSARYALDLLYESGRISEEMFDRLFITSEAIEEAEKILEVTKLSEQLRKLPDQPFFTLEAVYTLHQSGKPSVSSSDVYSKYRRLCHDYGHTPKSQRRMNDLLNDLNMAGLLDMSIVSKGRYGRFTEVRWIIPTKGKEFEIFQQQRQMRLV